MSLLRYAVSGVLRNRRRTFSAILGVLLAVTFIAGTFIAIDSSTRATLDASLRGIAGDFSFTAYPKNVNETNPAGSPNGTDLQAALAAVSGVMDVSLYRQIAAYRGDMYVYKAGNRLNASASYPRLFAIDPYHLPVELRNAEISGPLLLPNGTAVLDSETAANTQAKVGDTIEVRSDERGWNGTIVANYTIDFTLGAIATLAQSTYSYGFVSPGPYSPYPGGGLLAFNMQDMNRVVSRLNLSAYGPFQLQGEVWIDRSTIINPYDSTSTTYQITRLSRALNQAALLAGYTGTTINDNLSNALSSFSYQLLFQRIEFLVLSFPLILLGLYLGAVGVDLGHAERRRELGVLKTRGASRGQILSLLLLESILGGLVAAVLGLLFGIGLSRFLIGAITPFGASVDYGAFVLTPETVIAVAILSILFMGAASYRSAKRTADLPVIETLRYYAPGETHIQYKPAADIALVAYSVLVYVVVLYIQNAAGNLFIFFIGALLIATLPLVPILLIVGSVRLMTRSTGRVYEWVTRLIRPLAKNLEYVVSRNLSRNPRRSSNIAIIIALGLAFGIFVVSSFGSQQANLEQSLRASIGADIAVTPPYSPNMDASYAFAANLSRVAGVGAITHVQTISGQVSPSPSTNAATVVALNASTYFSVVQPASFYFRDPGTAAQAQAVLATPGQVLVTSQYAKDAAVEVGDTLVITVSTYDQNFTYTGDKTAMVKVGGMVRFLPGTYSGGFYGSMAAPDMVYGSNETFQALAGASPLYTGYGDRYLVSLQPGSDWKAVKDGILALAPSSLQVYAEQLAQSANDPFLSSFLGFIKMEIAFIVVILTAGLGLIMYAASLERNVEFAGITARGSSGWQTAGLLLGEAFAIMLIGVLIGLAVGLLTGYLSVSFGSISYGNFETAVPTLFVFPLDGLLLLVLAPAAMLGTALLVSWRIAHMNVARVLKMRGG